MTTRGVHAGRARNAIAIEVRARRSEPLELTSIN
jgi:hypothetical protein